MYALKRVYWDLKCSRESFSPGIGREVVSPKGTRGRDEPPLRGQTTHGGAGKTGTPDDEHFKETVDSSIMGMLIHLILKGQVWLYLGPAQKRKTYLGMQRDPGDSSVSTRGYKDLSQGKGPCGSTVEVQDVRDSHLGDQAHGKFSSENSGGLLLLT